MSACNVDLGHPCDANDGEPCAECVAWTAETKAAAWAEWNAAAPHEKHPKRYGFASKEEAEEAALRDAGRSGGR